jgi:hypothetical protein
LLVGQCDGHGTCSLDRFANTLGASDQGSRYKITTGEASPPAGRR